jgi:hypothetical protein
MSLYHRLRACSRADCRLAPPLSGFSRLGSAVHRKRGRGGNSLPPFLRGLLRAFSHGPEEVYPYFCIAESRLELTMKMDLFGTTYDPSGAPRTCSIEGCEERHYGRGWCRNHYSRWQKHGDPLYLSPIYKHYGEPTRWFNEHINDEADECITWPFEKNSAGYGMLRGKTVISLVCEFRYGPRPGIGRKYDACDGPCKNKLCINYHHLCWGTKRDNQLDRIRDGTWSGAQPFKYNGPNFFA